MRSRALGFLLCSLVFGVARTSHAGQLQSATWTQTLGPATFVHTATSTLSGSGGDFQIEGFSYLDGGVTSISVSLLMPGFADSALFLATPAFPISVFRKFTLGGAQQLGATQGMVSATMGLPGMAGLTQAILTAGSMHVPGAAIYQVPLDVGVSGVATRYFTVLGEYHYATVDFYGWTVHTQTFTGLTSRGMALPDVVAMGSWGLSPVNPIHTPFGGAGTITLVAPTRIAITGAIPRRTVSLTTLRLSFVSDGPYDLIPVPEPGVTLLLAAAGLVLLRSAKRPKV